MDKTVPNDIFHSGIYKCAYCGVDTRKSKCIRKNPPRNLRFIFYCDTHSSDAERDIKIVLKGLGLHRQSDVLKQPLFAVLPEDIVYDGGLGVLNKSLMEDSIELVLETSNGWAICIFNTLTGKVDRVPVSTLKQSLPDAHHGLVDEFIAFLKN